MGTTKLFQQDVYIKKWDAEITKITEKGFFLDRTAFFPEGGGQSCDTGTITTDAGTFKITDVQEDGNDVIHMTPSLSELKEGDTVQCALDWDRRFDNMQRHCGEHILSGIFYQEYGGVNRGFHMGADYMTVDISLEDEPTNPHMDRPEEVTWEMAKHCELLANEAIWSNAPVQVFRFDTREEAEKMPLRKKLAFDEDISIVCVGSPDHPADCVACCGTHPSTAGQVGLIKLYKVEKYKGMFRVYFESGKRALKDYDMKHDMLTELSNSHSCAIEVFPDKVSSIEAKLAETKAELAHLKKIIIDSECIALNEQIASCNENVCVYRLEDLSMDDAFNMAKNYMGNNSCSGKLIMLYSVPDTSYILVSDGTPECGPLVKEYASFYQGKGGGNASSARAIFTSEENALLFADLLSKHLQ